MSEPWLTVQGRDNVIAAWAVYANAHPSFDDVKTYMHLFQGGLNLSKAFSRQSPAKKWVFGGMLSTISNDPEFKARLTLDAMKIKYSTPEVMTFWGELSRAHVKRVRPDGQVQNGHLGLARTRGGCDEGCRSSCAGVAPEKWLCSSSMPPRQ